MRTVDRKTGARWYTGSESSSWPMQDLNWDSNVEGIRFQVSVLVLHLRRQPPSPETNGYANPLLLTRYTTTRRGLSHTGSHLALTLSCLIAVPVCAPCAVCRVPCAGEGKRSDSDTVRAASAQLPAGPSGGCIGAVCVPVRVPVPVRSGEC